MTVLKMTDLDLQGKRVLIREDLNVPVKDGAVKSDARILASLPTIKLALEKGRAAIDAEIERRLPLMRDGGFVIMPDHLITPGVPLGDYRYYLDRIRALRL